MIKDFTFKRLTENMGDHMYQYYRITNKFTGRVLYVHKRKRRKPKRMRPSPNYYNFYVCNANMQFFNDELPGRIFKTKKEILDFLFIYAI